MEIDFDVFKNEIDAQKENTASDDVSIVYKNIKQKPKTKIKSNYESIDKVNDVVQHNKLNDELKIKTNNLRVKMERMERTHIDVIADETDMLIPLKDLKP